MRKTKQVYSGGVPVQRVLHPRSTLVVPVAVAATVLVGGELVTNGIFAVSATGWTLETGWIYDTDKVTKNANGLGTLSQASIILGGKKYRLVFTMASRTAGSLVPQLGGTNGTSRLSDTTFTEYISAGADGDLVFTPSNDGRFSVSAVSVKEVLNLTTLGEVIRVISTADCYIRFGLTDLVLATSNDMFLKAGIEYYFSVRDRYLSVIRDSGDGNLYITLMD